MSDSERIRLLPRASAVSNGDHSFSFGVAVAFSLNYIMGTGFLTLPWAFSETGYLSFLVLGVMIVPSVMAINMILEAMSRADKYTEVFEHTSDGDYVLMDGVKEDQLPNLHPEGELLLVKEKKFEIVELCNMYMGPLVQLAYLSILCTYMFGTLWCYGTVFAHAFANKLHVFGHYSYLVYLLLFGMFVVPVSCMELKEQVSIQVTLAAGRVIMVTLMVSTVVISYLWGSPDDFGSDLLAETGDLFPFDSRGLHNLLPIATFANIFHHSIPALSEPVRDKRQLSNIFTVTLLCCFLAYSAVALSVSLYFGRNTLNSSNLNWKDYGNNSSGFLYFIKRIISTYVVMFPAFDVASAFPLNAITLGNNLFSVLFGNKVHILESSRTHKVAFRLLGAVPPLIMAACMSNLGTITGYTGITGFAIAFIFPPLLTYYSHVRLANHGLPINTVYSNFLTSSVFCALVTLFGIFLLIYVPISMRFDSE